MNDEECALVLYRIRKGIVENFNHNTCKLEFQDLVKDELNI